jgi:hypothetical protein
MIRFMTELFPVVPGPNWLKNRSQPIAIRNIIDYLVAALTNPAGRQGVFEIGGPEVTAYGDLMIRYARLRGLNRRLLMLPGIPVWFMAFGVGLMTPVPYPIAHALIEGLSADSLVRHPEALAAFPEVSLIDFDSAAREALEKTHPAHIERVWEDGSQTRKSLKHEGCFIIQRVSALPENQRRDGRMESRRTRFGDLWLEVRMERTSLTETLYFSPRGLPGFLYWYLLYPFHWLRFRSLIRAIEKQRQVT